MDTSLSLCLIVKDEADNIPRLFKSVKGCVDEIVLVDTGSTDSTVQVAIKEAADIGVKLVIEHFEWVNDFAKARNYAFSKATCAYIFWLDGDDVLKNQDFFITWKNNAMTTADFWLANYNYALNEDGRPMITFARERVFRRSKSPTWSYFIHEGITPTPDMSCRFTPAWYVDHMRTVADQVKDRSRNLNIIEARLGELDPRLKFYYGKELYENGQTEKAFKVLIDVSTEPSLQPHDRLLAIQYACYAQMNESSKMKPEFAKEKLALTVQLATQGLALDANRAEYWNIIGECLTQKGDLKEALPYYNAARACVMSAAPGSKSPAAIFCFSPLYNVVPTLQMAKIYFHMGDLASCEREATLAFAEYQSIEAKDMLEEIKKAKINSGAVKTPTKDIVFSCPFPTPYPFDEELYQSKGMGGSETALIEMAKLLKEKLSRRVIVFQSGRKDALIAHSGVEYLPVEQMRGYFTANDPQVHIAWRHNFKLTDARTYLWCHDLQTPSVEHYQNFEKMLVLSKFHFDYTKAMCGLRDDKLMLTKNGINPSKFDFERKAKNPNKMVWMSSPDRGLDRAIRVVELARKKLPNLELHVYYGLDNLYKAGGEMAKRADHLNKMMADRPWVTYHGFTEQSKMYRSVSDAAVWIHPCDFIETFCITAIEMLALQIFPITRNLGAIANTLGAYAQAGKAVLLDHDCITKEEFDDYVAELVKAVEEKAWERLEGIEPSQFAWSNVADQWVKEMALT